jgi:hypothetical protein
VPTVLAKASAKPVKDSVGSPLTPLPLARDSPEPLTANDRAVIVFAAVLTTIPVPALSNEPLVPFKLIVYAPCAPPSVMPNPTPVEKYRLLGRPLCRPTVKNVCVSEGLEVIAETVVCTVKPFWTTGTSSVPVMA